MRRPYRQADFCCQSLEGRILCASAIYESGRHDYSASPARDLGTINARQASAGVRDVASIAPGGRSTFRLKLDFAGDFVLWCHYTGDRIALIVSGPSGKATITPDGSDYQVYRFRLEAGDYRLTAVAEGTGPVHIDWELLLDNGAGQSSAISLPVAAASGVAPLNVSFAPPVAPGGTSPNSVSPPSSPALAVGLSLLPESLPLGAPTAFSEHVEVVGPAVERGPLALALADAGPGLNPGHFIPKEEGGRAEAQRTGPLVNRSDSRERSAEEDLAVLVSTEWIDRIAGSMGNWLSGVEDQPPEDSIPDDGQRTGLRDRLTLRADPMDRQTWNGGVSITWIIPIAAMAARYRRRSPRASIRSQGSVLAFMSSRSKKIHPAGPSLSPAWRRGSAALRNRSRSTH